jgi:uncharacterized protein YndB with AHSA1/START domain
MPIISIDLDIPLGIMMVRAEIDAPARRIWDAYVDPRALEQFWGLEGSTTRFFRHDAAAGGRSRYITVGPELGRVSHGYWQWVSLEEGSRFELLHGLALPDGTPDPETPTMHVQFNISPLPDGRTALETVTTFEAPAQIEDLQQLSADEALRSSMFRIDDLVAAPLASGSPGNGVRADLLSDTQVRVSRVLVPSVAQVWSAHHEPSLLRRWLLGPDGWTMPECTVAEEVKDFYRYEWQPTDGGDGRFGYIGELLEQRAPVRSVTSEAMLGVKGPATRNELTLAPLAGGTLLSLVVTYPSTELRDAALDAGMTDRMEHSFRRLDQLFA